MHALSTYHEQIGLSNLSLCKVPDHLVDEAARFVSELTFSDSEMHLTLTTLPVSSANAKSFWMNVYSCNFDNIVFCFCFSWCSFSKRIPFLLHSRHCVNSCSLDAAACFSLLCPIHCVNGEAEGTMQQRKSVALQRLWKRQQNCFYMTRTGSPNKKEWQAAHLPADYIIK